jgi:peptide/nickel transport system permease protein
VRKQVDPDGLSVGPRNIVGIVGRSPARLAWLRLRRNRAGMASGITLTVLLLIALAAPVIELMYGIGPLDQFQGLLDRFGMPIGYAGG